MQFFLGPCSEMTLLAFRTVPMLTSWVTQEKGVNLWKCDETFCKLQQPDAMNILLPFRKRQWSPVKLRSMQAGCFAIDCVCCSFLTGSLITFWCSKLNYHLPHYYVFDAVKCLAISTWPKRLKEQTKHWRCGWISFVFLTLVIVIADIYWAFSEGTCVLSYLSYKVWSNRCNCLSFKTKQQVQGSNLPHS